MDVTDAPVERRLQGVGRSPSPPGEIRVPTVTSWPCVRAPSATRETLWRRHSTQRSSIHLARARPGPTTRGGGHQRPAPMGHWQRGPSPQRTARHCPAAASPSTTGRQAAIPEGQGSRRPKSGLALLLRGGVTLLQAAQSWSAPCSQDGKSGPGASRPCTSKTSSSPAPSSPSSAAHVR